MASRSPSRPGLVLDWTLFSTATLTLAGDTTWYVSGAVTVTNLVIEGGAVVKFTNSPAAGITVNGPVATRTGPFRPAIFTAKDDNSVGEPIPGATGNPTATFYGAPMLRVQAAASTLRWLRFSHAAEALRYEPGSSHELEHAQFVRCAKAVIAPYAGLELRNALIHQAGTAFDAAAQPAAIRAQHVTFSQVSTGLLSTTYAGVLYATNCVFAQVGVVAGGGLASAAGSHNGFFSTAAFGGSPVTLATSPFETVGLGAHYLAYGSAAWDAGTTAITPSLLAALASLTCRAPLEIATHFTNSQVLQPWAWRDTNAPDLGYHYAPLDYVWTGRELTNATLTLTHGVGVGTYGVKGLTLRRGAVLRSEGAATALNRLTRVHLVQEQWAPTNSLWGTNAPTMSLLDVNATSPKPVVDLRFTEVTVPGNSVGRRQFILAAQGLGGFSARDSRFHHTRLELTPTLGIVTIALTNCLVERPSWVLNQAYSGTPWLTLHLRNLLVRGGSVAWSYQNTSTPWTIHDNLWDGCAISSSVADVYNYPLPAAYNAFRAAASFGSPTKTLTTCDYVTGPLGDHYYPTTGTQLATLVNWDTNRSPASLGLYHHTLLASLAKETNSPLDVGFHYVATDAQGAPADQDGDGIPDWWEDADSDYDGISDTQEALDGTNPYDSQSVTLKRLAYWRFNHADLPGEGGQWPLSRGGAPLAATWSGTGVSLMGTSDWLAYRDVEPGGAANVNVRNGTVRLWLRPSWTSKGLGGTGPGTWGRLVSVGRSWDAIPTNNYWALDVNPEGDGLRFYSHNDEFRQMHFENAAIQWQAGRWYQVVLTYSPTNVACYVNGRLVSHGFIWDWRPIRRDGSGGALNLGEGVHCFPSPPQRALGLHFGNEYLHGQPLKAVLDEIETFNHPLPPEQVAREAYRFPGGASDGTDTDYDGRTDFAELHLDGTSSTDPAAVVPVRLAHLRFNDPALTGDAGQLPLATNAVGLPLAWSGPAAALTSTGAVLKYRDVETNGWPNFCGRQGAVKLWFRPGWTSGFGPASGYLLYLGHATSPTTSRWALSFTNLGSTLIFSTADGTGAQTLLAPAVSLTAGRWYQVALNYGPAGCALYLNGVLAASTTTPLTKWPPPADRANGVSLGNLHDGSAPVQGWLDEVEFFNHPLDPAALPDEVQARRRFDRDLNGVPDAREDLGLAVPEPFVAPGEPFPVAGAWEAEQYDHGGPGVGHGHQAGAPLVDLYRPSRLLLGTVDDLGGGYGVKLRAGEWTRYTLDVRAAGTYAVEARAAASSNLAAFQFQFSTNGAAYLTTNLVFGGAGWTNLGARFLPLAAGTNVLKVTALTNAAGTNVCALFNWFTAYPCWVEGATNLLHTIHVTDLVPNSTNWSAALTNTLRLQAAMAAALAHPDAEGVTIQIPAGRFHVAQKLPDENKLPANNAVLPLWRNNIVISGAGAANSTLVAHNRATVLISLRWNQFDARQAFTNVTIQNLGLEGRPHWRAVTNASTGGFDVVWEQGALHPVDTNENDLGCLIFAFGKDYPVIVDGDNLLITDCLLRNPAATAITIRGLYRNVAVRNCLFLNGDGPEGGYPFPRSISYPTNLTALRPYTSANIFCRAAGKVDNVIVVSNVFSGNPALTLVNTNYWADAADGLVWFQAGGNWLVAHNVLTNYALEGTALYAGPAAVVANRFHTWVSLHSTCALLGSGEGFGGLTGSPADLALAFVGNDVRGGRRGHFAALLTNVLTRGYRLDLAGSTFELWDAFPRDNDRPGAVAHSEAVRLLNLSGNTLRAGAQGLHLFRSATNLLVLHNDFAAAGHRAVFDQLEAGRLEAAVVAGSRLGRGLHPHHARPAHPRAARWQFWGNTHWYATNTFESVLRQEHPQSPTHVTP